MSNDLLLTAGGTAAAVLVVAWPRVKTLLGALPWPVRADAAKATGISFQAAIASLAGVRGRLSATGCLSDEGVKEAIDTLTLALVRGSDL